MDGRHSFSVGRAALPLFSPFADWKEPTGDNGTFGKRQRVRSLVLSYFGRICNFVRGTLTIKRRGESRPSRDLVFCFVHKRRNGIVTRGNAFIATMDSQSLNGRPPIIMVHSNSQLASVFVTMACWPLFYVPILSPLS